MIHFFQYYSLSKNFGAAINNECLSVNDHDWICITDMDTMFLRPDAGRQIYDIVERYKDKFSLIGCTTNRLAQTHQLYNNEFSKDSDIRNHMKIANELHEKYYAIVEPTRGQIAGCFMLFPKRVWNKLLFEENTPRFDIIFTERVINYLNGRVGIAKGLYQFHLYRMWSDSPKTDINHLL